MCVCVCVCGGDADPIGPAIRADTSVCNSGSACADHHHTVPFVSTTTTHTRNGTEHRRKQPTTCKHHRMQPTTCNQKKTKTKKRLVQQKEREIIPTSVAFTPQVLPDSLGSDQKSSLNGITPSAQYSADVRPVQWYGVNDMVVLVVRVTCAACQFSDVPY